MFRDPGTTNDCRAGWRRRCCFVFAELKQLVLSNIAPETGILRRMTDERRARPRICLHRYNTLTIRQFFFQRRKVRVVAAIFVDLYALPARQRVGHPSKRSHHSPLVGVRPCAPSPCWLPWPDFAAGGAVGLGAGLPA